MPDFSQLAEEMAQSLGEGSEEWKQTLERLYQSSGEQEISVEEYEEVVRACGSLDRLSFFFREFFKFTKQDPQKRSAYKFWVSELDESAFSLADWCDSISFVYGWLEKKGQTARWDIVIGYLRCCEQSPEAQLFSHNLIDLAQKMLEEHGFEKTQPL